MSDYNVAVVGIGMVGAQMLQVLRERGFPAKSYKVLATRKRTERIGGHDYDVDVASVDAFEGVDVAFFAGTEGAKGASQEYGWAAVDKGCIVIDNGQDFRMDDRCPLVVPEVNPDAIKDHQGFIASPNCSTIQMVVALAPLHRAAGIKRIVVSTYQAVSGTGRAGVAELKRQMADLAAGKPTTCETYPYQIAYNVVPQIGSETDALPGYTSEEWKMVAETRKILGDDSIQVSATTVRVPVVNGHSETINVQLEKKLTADEAREILAAAPGVTVTDDLANSKFPTPLHCSGTDATYVGRIREDRSAENALDLWCVSDNIRKGAATNTIQIAEKMIEMGLL